MITNRVDMSDDTVLYTLQLPSKVDSITSVENFVDTLKDEYNIGDDTYANMLTCLSEATINAIVHGNKQDESKKVYINLEVQSGKRLQFTVADEGEGFDYNRLPDPTAPENLENLTGRGVFIIKHLADQCIFNLKGNEVELHFKV
ncbi:ATP-binding protein [Paradesertivirga mongoliensis]|uniref:ATP-binding protein n=2 Tax=Paradesertivirga mongoliensis TaxID=2100740 RepID=A0ABW4ZJC0_9SPHI|nr:ATP-binding protein [Pedobacter mongoliensis]